MESILLYFVCEHVHITDSNATLDTSGTQETHVLLRIRSCHIPDDTALRCTHQPTSL